MKRGSFIFGKGKIKEILQKNQHNGTPVFAERYIGGREFNISMIGGAIPSRRYFPLRNPVSPIFRRIN